MTDISTHMTVEIQGFLRSKYENPITTFVNYDVVEKMSEKEQKTLNEMSDVERQAYLDIPEDLRLNIKKEYRGLIQALSIATDLVYEIANGIPNNSDKYVALGLMDKVCVTLAESCNPNRGDKK